MPDNPYRILSLDGGGPWALIQACVLGEMYPGESGHQILGHFDLALGNSGGSITLAGLIKDLTPTQICDLFLQQSNREKIFRPINLASYYIDKSLHVGPKWSTDAKYAGLVDLMDAAGSIAVANMRFTDLSPLVESRTKRKLQIVVTTFDYDLNREIFFCSQNSPLSNSAGFEPTLAGAVHASSNAPVNYFDAPAVVVSVDNGGSRRFWDGGVGGYNNPVLHGVIEALSNNVRPDNIVALSIGSATVWRPIGSPTKGESRELFAKSAKPTMLGDITKMAESILDDPPDASTLNAYFVTKVRDQSRIVRLNPEIAPVLTADGWTLPEGFSRFDGDDEVSGPLHALDAFMTLRDMPMDAVDQKSVEMIHQLATLWMDDLITNQPIQRDYATGTCLIGQSSYTSAKAAWFSF